MATKQNVNNKGSVKAKATTAKASVKKGVSKTKMAMAAAGLAAVGAGAYYLMGPKGKANQKKAKVLMAKMEKEAKLKLKQAKAVAKPAYDKTVDVLADNYSREYKAYEADIKALAKRLKGEWKSASSTAKKAIRKATK